MKKCASVLFLLAVLLAATAAFAETVWVANKDGDSISIIDPENDTVVAGYSAPCTFGLCIVDPTDFTFNPLHPLVYVLSPGTNKIVTLSTEGVNDEFDDPTWAGYAAVTAYSDPQAILASPDGLWLYVAESENDSVAVYDIDDVPSTPYLETGVEVGNNPYGMAITEDSDTLLVVNRQDGTVSVIDTSTHEVAHTVSVGSLPERIIVGNIGGVGVRAYTVNSASDNVSVLSVTSTPSVSATVSVGDKPRGLTFYPNMGR